MRRSFLLEKSPCSKLELKPTALQRDIVGLRQAENLRSGWLALASTWNEPEWLTLGIVGRGKARQISV